MDLFFNGQAHHLLDHLTCPTAMLKFTDAEGAGAHCEVGASRLGFTRIYDWLEPAGRGADSGRQI